MLDALARTAVLHAVGASRHARPGDNATLYINGAPCPGNPVTGWKGCEQMLEQYVPKGATLTVYGPENFVRVIVGTR